MDYGPFLASSVTLPWAKDPENLDGIVLKGLTFKFGELGAACFDTGITEELVKKLAARKPLRAVFRDSGFGSDAVKINVEQIFKLISPGTEVKAI